MSEVLTPADTTFDGETVLKNGLIVVTLNELAALCVLFEAPNRTYPSMRELVHATLELRYIFADGIHFGGYWRIREVCPALPRAWVLRTVNRPRTAMTLTDRGESILRGAVAVKLRQARHWSKALEAAGWVITREVGTTREYTHASIPGRVRMTSDLDLPEGALTSLLAATGFLSKATIQRLRQRKSEPRGLTRSPQQRKNGLKTHA